MSSKMAVLVKRYPKLSETFILGEIATLIDQGMELDIISIYLPNEARRQPAAKALQERVTYLEHRSTPSVMATLFKCLMRTLFGSVTK